MIIIHCLKEPADGKNLQVWQNILLLVPWWKGTWWWRCFTVLPHLRRCYLRGFLIASSQLQIHPFCTVFWWWGGDSQTTFLLGRVVLSWDVLLGAPEGGQKDMLLPVCFLGASCLLAAPGSQPCSASPCGRSICPGHQPNSVFSVLHTWKPLSPTETAGSAGSLLLQGLGPRPTGLPISNSEAPTSPAAAPPKRSELRLHRTSLLCVLSWGLEASSHNCYLLIP